VGEFFVGAYIVFSALYFIWLGRTVRTQADTIGALQALLDSMRTVLESTDETTMLERLKAHKEFVEHEKDAYRRQVDEEKEDAIKKVNEGSKATTKALISRHVDLMIEVLFMGMRMMPYVPPEIRLDLIGATDFGGYKGMEERVKKHASEAPYLPAKGGMMAKDFLQIVASPKKD